MDDLESDFSAIHRIDDIYALDGPKFFRLAHRISAYQGVIAARAMELQNNGAMPSTTTAAAHSEPETYGDDLVAINAAQVRGGASPLFEISQVKKAG